MNTVSRTFKVNAKNYYYFNEVMLLRKEIVLLISNISSITFKELERQFYLFTNLPPLNVTLVTNAKTKQELVYLLFSFKLTLTTK